MEYNPYRILGGGIVAGGLPPVFFGPHPGLSDTIVRVGMGSYRFTLSEPTDIGALLVCCTTILIGAGVSSDGYNFVREASDTILIDSSAGGVLADIDYSLLLVAILPS